MAGAIRKKIVFLIGGLLIALAGFVFLCFLALCIVWATFDDDDYRRLAIRGVGFFTDYSMAIEGPFKFELSANPRIYAEDVRIYPEENRQPPVTRKIGKFGARIAIAPLLTGTLVVRELEVDDALMVINLDESDGGNQDSKIPDDIDLPVFESVQLRNIQLDILDAAADRTIDVRVQELFLDDVQNAGPMFISGKGTFSGQEFEINGRMGALAAMLTGGKPYPVDYSVKFAGIRLSVAGTLKDFAEGEGMQLNVSGEAVELAEVLKMLKIDTPPIGRLKFEATVNHDLESPEIPFLSAALTENPDIQFSAHGSIANALTLEGANIDLAGVCAIPEILRLFRLRSPGLLEQARVSGSLQEKGGVLSLEKLKVEALSGKGTTASIEGRIGLGEPGAAMSLNNIDLSLQVFLPTSEMLNPLVFERLPEIGPVVGKAQLTGSAEVLSLENLDLAAGGNGPLQMTTKGSISAKLAGKQVSLSGFDLAIGIKSETTSLLADAYGTKLPELGAVAATYQLVGNRDQFKLDRFDVETVTSKDLRTSYTGTISFDRKANSKLTGEFDLKVTLAAPDLGPSTAPLGFSALPELRRVRGEAKISGTTEAVSLNNISLNAGVGGPVRLDIGGSVGRIRWGHKQPLQGANLTVAATAPEWAALPGLAEIKLPELGSVRMEARIEDRGDSLNVDPLKIVSTSNETSPLTIQGRIFELTDPEKRRLEASFEIMSNPFVLTYLKQPDGEDTLVTGQIKARATNNGIRIDALRLETADGKALNVDASGTIGNPAGEAGIDLQISATAPDPPAIGRIIGLAVPKLSPVSFEGQVSGKLPDVGLNGKVSVGETGISTTLKMTAGSARPRIVGKIFSKTVDLREMGIYPEEAPQESSTVTSQGGSPERLFGDRPLMPFEALKAVDLSLTIDAEKLIDRDISIRNLDVDILLDDGRLTIDPIFMSYSAGFTDFDVVIDASGPAPRYDVKITGEDIDVDDLLARAHEPVIMSGSFNLLADLQSSGRSAREIAANLNGVLSFALENGQIWRIINLLSKDPLDILLTSVDQRKYTDVHCLTHKITFEEGIGTVDILQMDSPKIRARGAGKIDLKAETIELVINPQRKRSLFRSRSAVHLSGALGNPSVSTLPLSEAAELYGTILLPFVFLPARALGYLWSLIANDRDGTPCVMDGG